MAEENQEKQVATKAQSHEWTIGVKSNALAFAPRNWQEMLDFATLVCKTEFVPPDFRDKPGAVIAAWQTGHEIGLPPMASIKYIAVINGRTRIWGNAYWALVKSHPLCEWTEELPEHEALEKGYGECTVKRKGDKPLTARFTKEMAERSGVWGGKGDTKEKRERSVWFLRPGRMLQWMARNLAGNDAIPEATLGIEIAELAEGEPRDVTPPTEPLKMPKAIDSPARAKADPVMEGAGQPLGNGKEKSNEEAEAIQGSTTTPNQGSRDTRDSSERVDRSNRKLEDRKAEALKFCREIPDDEWTARPKNWLETAIKGMSSKDQLDVARAHNERNQAIKAAEGAPEAK